MSTPDDDLDDEEEEEEEEEEDEVYEEKMCCTCRCGECCRRLIIEVDLEDAAREPEIAELGSPTCLPGKLTRSGKEELIGYMLNSPKNDMACIFLDQKTNACTIYETRPLGCRVFDCDGQGKDQLIELGILDRKNKAD